MEQNVRPYKHLRGTKILDIETAKTAGFEEGEIAITHGVSGDSRLYVLSQDGNSIDTFISQAHIENLLLEIEEVASSSLNDLNTRLNIVSGDVATNKELLSEHELISISAISTLSGSVVNNKDNISVLSGSVVNNQDNISTLSGNVINNINDILTLSGSVITLSTSDISTLSGSVINVKNDLSVLSGSVIDNMNEIDEVVSASLNDLNTRLTTVSGDVATNKELLSEHELISSTLSGDVINVKNDLLVLSGSVSDIFSLSGSVINNNSDISTLSGSVVNIKNDLSTLSGSVVNNKDNMSTLSGSVVNNKNDISTLSGSVVNVKNDISTLSGSVVDSIDEIEKVTAASLNDLKTRLNTVADDSEIYNVYKQLDGTLSEKTFKILYKYMFTPFIVNSNGTTTIPDELINDSGTNFITEYYWNYMRLTGGEPIVTTTWNGHIPLKFKGLLNGKTYSIDYTTKTITVEA